MAATDARAGTGFYCSTSGTYFTDKEQLAEHYKSDFHRYNLKRKVAGLPPVTKEWFDARKAQLASVKDAPAQKIWFDPLTRKKFMSEQTYQAHVKSKKYTDLVAKSGQPAPAPVMMTKKAAAPNDDAVSLSAASTAATGSSLAASGGQQQGYTAKNPAAAYFRQQAAAEQQRQVQQELEGMEEEEGDDEEEEEDGGSDWETASEEEVAELVAAGAVARPSTFRARRQRHQAGAAAAAAAAVSAADDGDAEGGSASGGGSGADDWEDWDLRRSLFDNHVSRDFKSNLEYMYKNYGFYFPDAEYLSDPEGLLKYLGAKLRYGQLPLYARGDDPNPKTFRSLHAVQRHMVDRNQCKMVYDGNEEEYEDYYDYSASAAMDVDGGDAASSAATNDGGGGGQLIVVDSDAVASAGGYELVVQGGGGGGGGVVKVLGSREFARYYRQRHKAADGRQSVAVNTMLAQYRSLGIATTTGSPVEALQQRQAAKAAHVGNKHQMKVLMSSNVIRNLPKNVPY